MAYEEFVKNQVADKLSYDVSQLMYENLHLRDVLQIQDEFDHLSDDNSSVCSVVDLRENKESGSVIDQINKELSDEENEIKSKITITEVDKARLR